MIFALQVLGILVITAIAIILSIIKWQLRYWPRIGMPSIEPTFPFGNKGNPFIRKTHFSIFLKGIYNQFKEMGVKHGGIYLLSNPVYVPIDPDILRNIMLKDFRYFNDRGIYYNDRDDPLSAHLFSLHGTKWRNLRTKLTSAFTSGKMKMMFNSMLECAKNMEDAIDSDACAGPINIKDILTRFTIDVIGLCAFGIKCNSFKNSDAEFPRYAKSIFRPVSKWKTFVNTFAFLKPEWARKLRIVFFPQDVTNFFSNVVKQTLEFRKSNDVKRNDMIQLLTDLTIDESEDTHNDNKLTFHEIAAQMFVFFIAGSDTSSATLVFCLYELALNPNIQNRVRNEITTVLEQHNGQVTYEAIMEMKYMGQVIDETLRKYPAIAYLTRKCVEDYKIPESDMVIRKGTKVYISTLGLHRDPKNFPKPEEFDPERFSDENRCKIQPFSYLPFGEGPRICIGLRFGLMQTKIGLITMLKNYVMTLNRKTAAPLEIDCHNFAFTVKDGVWLNFKKIV